MKEEIQKKSSRSWSSKFAAKIKRNLAQVSSAAHASQVVFAIFSLNRPRKHKTSSSLPCFRGCVGTTWRQTSEWVGRGWPHGLTSAVGRRYVIGRPLGWEVRRRRCSPSRCSCSHCTCTDFSLENYTVKKGWGDSRPQPGCHSLCREGFIFLPCNN